MPIKKTVLAREPQPVPEQEEIEERAELPAFEPAEAEATQPGRPHQAFVESQLRQYLHDNNIRSLVKPTREEIRAAAMPILCQARRRRTGRDLQAIAHHAVADVAEHIREERWTRRPLTEAYASATYLDALIQLADDTDWLARKIPLPAHCAPHHPPIYYTTDPETRLPVPRADSLIRADYVRDYKGARVTGVSHFRPWLSRAFDPLEYLWRGNAFYTLELTPENDVEVTLYWFVDSTVWNMQFRMVSPLSEMYFFPQP